MKRLPCNIDSKGRVLRLIFGSASLLAGVAMLWMLRQHVVAGTGYVAIATTLVVSGALGVFQGWSGWCAIRALGFKTRW
jgi:hypothetical protein